jgi:PKD repeat protein
MTGSVRRWLLALGLAAAVVPGVALGGTAPVASFTTSPPAPAMGQVVTFDASASQAPGGGQIASYRWSFGDGDTQNTIAATTTHIFRNAGAFTTVSPSSTR